MITYGYTPRHPEPNESFKLYSEALKMLTEVSTKTQVSDFLKTPGHKEAMEFLKTIPEAAYEIPKMEKILQDSLKDTREEQKKMNDKLIEGIFTSLPNPIVYNSSEYPLYTGSQIEIHLKDNDSLNPLRGRIVNMRESIFVQVVTFVKRNRQTISDVRNAEWLLIKAGLIGAGLWWLLHTSPVIRFMQWWVK